MRNLGGSVGISTVTTLLARRQQEHQVYLTRHTFAANLQVQQALAGMTSRFSSRSGTADATRHAQGQIYATVQHQAAVLAYIDTFWIMGALCLLAIGLLFFAKKNRPGSAAMAH
jgi:DHA2 family multidrug resistance protein